jgi:NADH-quinone oxidoreductase subunit H
VPTISPSLVFQLTLIAVVFFSLQISAAVLVYFERKISAWAQQRVGPNRVGPLGLLQPLADIVKLIFKEELRPTAADKWLFYLAPVLSATTAFAAFAVIPFGPPTTFFGLLEKPVPLQVADLNVAVLVVFAITSMGIYGIVLAGWASNSKYALLGGLRSSAQMVSYELAYGMSLASVLVIANSLSLREIVDAQAGAWWLFHVLPVPKWYVFLAPVGFFIFFVAGIAETNRAPFDFPEAEQELVAGYHTEYSSMSFALFFLAEYVNMVVVCGVAVSLFLGGFHVPGLPDWLGPLWFVGKVAVLLFFYIWMRWTLPRYRYDQLMDFGWKRLLPLSIVNLLVTAAGVLYWS